MTMFLPVVSTIKVSISARDVVEHGAGPVRRNTVAHITTRRLDNAWLPRIRMINVAVRNQVLKKKITALEDIVRIVRSDGSKSKSHIPPNAVSSLPQ